MIYEQQIQTTQQQQQQQQQQIPQENGAVRTRLHRHCRPVLHRFLADGSIILVHIISIIISIIIIITICMYVYIYMYIHMFHYSTLAIRGSSWGRGF